VRLAAIVLTKNEERDLPGCLESLKGVADEVYVVDSGSTERTVEIAEGMGAVVLTHPFENNARQMNWAIENIGTSAGWLMRIDADERVDGEMGRWLREFVESDGGGQARDVHGGTREPVPKADGAMVALRVVFLGKRLRFGGTFPVWLLRVWRRGQGRCEDRWMDEHMVVVGGEVVKARGELVHVIPKSLSEWSRKHVWYAERECLDAMATGQEAWPGRNTTATGQQACPTGATEGSRADRGVRPTGEGGLTGQAGVKRAAKTKVYYRLPPMVRVMAFWFYRYVAQLGFLDGKAGFLYHFLQCAWYRMLVDGMLMERESRSPRV